MTLIRTLITSAATAAVLGLIRRTYFLQQDTEELDLVVLKHSRQIRDLTTILKKQDEQIKTLDRGAHSTLDLFEELYAKVDRVMKANKKGAAEWSAEVAQSVIDLQDQLSTITDNALVLTDKLISVDAETNTAFGRVKEHFSALVDAHNNLVSKVLSLEDKHTDPLPKFDPNDTATH